MKIRTAIAALIGGVIIATGTANFTPAGAAADSWNRVSKDALARAVAADKGVTDPFPYSYTGAAIVRNFGWTPSAQHYLDAVLAAQHADGGWGNPFGDKTLSHTVTTTQHVGPFVLMGYKAKRVPLKTVTRMLDYVYKLGRDHNSLKHGWCLAPNLKSNLCIHNISAGAALFVGQAAEAGIKYRPGMARELLVNVTKREVAEYNRIKAGWVYRDDLPLWNDQDHNALCIEAMLRLAPAIGRDALGYSLGLAHDETAPLAHVHLKQFDRKAGAAWVPEVRDYLNKPLPAPRPGQNLAMWRYAEIAFWGSL